MKPIIRLKEISVSNVKNVEEGKITTLSDFDSINKSDIIGIYGQNGSGKTAIIDVLEMLKTLLSAEKISKRYNNLVNVNHEKLSIFCKFLVKNDFGEFYLEYECQIGRMGENFSHYNLTEEELNTNKVLFEKLRYKENIKRKRWKTILQRTVSRQEKLSLKEFISLDDSDLIIGNESAFSVDNEYRFLMRYADLNSAKKSTSYLFSNEMDKLYDELLSKTEIELIKNLKSDFNRDFHVIGCNHTGYILANIAMPFTIHLPQSRGIIPYNLDKPVTLPIAAYKALNNVVDQINIVLDNLVPDVIIEIRPIVEETLENGKKGMTFEFLSIKSDKNIPLRCESSGVLKLISILSALIAVFNNPNAFVAIDELDAGIFEYLLGELLEVLTDSGRGQLIFTSHNLRLLEVLPNKNMWFTTTSGNNRFIRLSGIRKTSNPRDVYLRAVQVGGQQEELYHETDSYNIRRAFRKAGNIYD
jgi:AAA15 family ATPase/GTPase